MTTLLLNADYTPYQLIGWKQALGLLWQETPPVVCLEMSSKYKLDSKGRKHYIPSILVLKGYFPNKGKATYSKRNVYARDEMICQYCGLECNTHTISIDHVIPRAKWNKAHGRVSTFENVVTCCKRCNRRKGDRTPEQAKMKLLKQPKRMSRQTLIANKAKVLGLYNQWQQYLESYNDTTTSQS